MDASLTGAEFKKQLRAGATKLGLFLNSHSPTVADQRHDIILGLFRFGTARVGEFLEKGFRFISIGNDLHHILTQSGAYVKDVEGITPGSGKAWTRRASSLI